MIDVTSKCICGFFMILFAYTNSCSSGRQFAENITALHGTAVQLAHRPEGVPLYMVRLYMLSLQRSATLAQLEVEEKHSLDAMQTAYAEERERVEDEWKRGRDRVRERLVEGIEERRRRAREEKEGEGTVGGKLHLVVVAQYVDWKSFQTLR